MVKGGWIMKKVFLLFLIIMIHFHIHSNVNEGSTFAAEKENFVVKSFVKDHHMYVEYYANNHNANQSVLVYIDGKKYAEIERAAFVIKDLPKGTHVIRLELMNQNGNKTGQYKQFSVHI